MYSLDKSSRKYVCPRCGLKRFVLYLDHDGTGQPLDVTVGRCDREQSCGYHYTPRMFFADHPDRRTQQPTVGTYQRKPQQRTLFAPVALLSFIPPDVAQRYRCNYMQTDFCQFLLTAFTPEQVQAAADKYMLGACNGTDVVYWQIDEHQRIRAGKVMAYDRATGHRRKDIPTAVGWLHTRLNLPDAWKNGFTQCFFGQHLLADNTYKSICIVESEKTAVICSIVFPQSFWVATGGKGLLGKLLLTEGQVLRGRHVTVYPDAGCLTDWQAVCEPYRKVLSLHFSDTLEVMGAAEGRDIADFLLLSQHQPQTTVEQQPQEQPQHQQEQKPARRYSDIVVPLLSGAGEPTNGRISVPQYLVAEHAPGTQFFAFKKFDKDGLMSIDWRFIDSRKV